jgi:hypothetical protein
MKMMMEINSQLAAIQKNNNLSKKGIVYHINKNDCFPQLFNNAHTQ